MALFQESNLLGLPVLSENGQLFGIVTLQDVHKAEAGEGFNSRGIKVADIAITDDGLGAAHRTGRAVAIDRVGTGLPSGDGIAEKITDLNGSRHLLLQEVTHHVLHGGESYLQSSVLLFIA